MFCSCFVSTLLISSYPRPVSIITTSYRKTGHQIPQITEQGLHVTSLGLSRQILHLTISLYSRSSCWSFSTIKDPSVCAWRWETVLLATSNSSSILLLSNLINKMWLSALDTNRKQDGIYFNTSLSLNLSAAPAEQLDLFQL